MSTGKLLFVSMFLFALFSSATLQAANYAVVYALDTRPPAEVFKNGFSTDGTLLDVLEHALGGACTAETTAKRSAWISTTSNFDRAFSFAERRIAALPGLPFEKRRMWIYQIRTDANFLEVSDLLRQARAAGDAQTSKTIDYLLQHTRIAEREEVVVASHIPTTNIEGAANLYYDPAATDGRPFYQTINSTYNSGYRLPSTTMTNVVSNLSALLPPESIARFGRHLPPNSQLCELVCATPHPNRVRQSTEPSGLDCLARPARNQAFLGSEEE